VLREVVSIERVNVAVWPGVTVTEGGVKAHVVIGPRSPAGIWVTFGPAIGGQMKTTVYGEFTGKLLSGTSCRL
jgi:hypothetical protein